MQFRAAEADPFDPRAFLYRERLPDADPEDPQVRSAAAHAYEPCSLKLTLSVCFASRVRRKETYEFFKAPLDALYALGEPGSGSSKL